MIGSDPLPLAGEGRVRAYVRIDLSPQITTTFAPLLTRW